MQSTHLSKREVTRSLLSVRNFAFIEFRGEKAAEEAKKELNGASIAGQTIKVRNGIYIHVVR